MAVRFSGHTQSLSSIWENIDLKLGKKNFHELQMEQIKKRLSHWIDIVTPTTSEKVTFGSSNLIETSSNHNKGRKMIGLNVGKLLEIIKKARLS